METIQFEYNPFEVMKANESNASFWIIGTLIAILGICLLLSYAWYLRAQKEDSLY